MRKELRGGAPGLYISGDIIAAAVAVQAHGRTEIAARGSVATPKGAVDGASIIDPPRVGQAIRALLRDLGASRATAAAIALPFPGYSMRSLRVPDVPVRERRTLIRGELEQIAALPFGGGAFDYLWMPAAVVEGRRQAEVCACYTSDAEIDAIRTTLRLAGLRMQSVEPASMALMRCGMASLQKTKAVAIVSASAKHTDFCIHDGRLVRHFRRIPAGWVDVRQSPGQAPSLAAAGASVAEPGPFDVPTAELQAAAEDEAKAMASAAPAGLTPQGLQRTPSADFLIGEVSRSLAFFAREFPDAPKPETMLVVGPEDAAKFYRELLGDAVQLEVASSATLEAMGVPAAHCVADVADLRGAEIAAIGAALGAATDAETMPLVDVSQQEEEARVRRRAPQVLLIGMAGSTLWMILAVAAALGLTYLETTTQAQVSNVSSQIDQIKKEQAAKLKQMEVENAAKGLEAKSEVPAGAILGRVAEATTPGVGVTSIKAGSDGNVTVEGEALDTGAMQRFALALNQGISTRTPYFSKMNRTPPGRLAFTIVGTFRSGAAK